MRVHITVPASTSNLGPGFDVIGLALDIVNEVTAETRDDGVIGVDPGPGMAAALGEPEHNMVVRAYLATCTAAGVREADRGAYFTCINRIPLARGLGSSAAAALAGVLAANSVHHLRWNSEQILGIATAMEGHPDNAAAAMLGGLVICPAGAAPVRSRVHADLAAVLFVPATEMPTALARTVVPDTFSRADAVFNLGRCALLVHALLTGDSGTLRTAMQDRWHQPQRSALLPALPHLIDAANAAGAFGAALSGAGPTVIALSGQERCDAIAQSMRASAHVAGVEGTTMICALRDQGARAEVVG